jgi:hypothetical protein
MDGIFNEGEIFFMAPILTGSILPASAFYVGLMTNAILTMPAASSTLASLIQYEISVTNGGYAIRQQINRDTSGLGWQLSLTGGIWTATSPSLTWTATDPWTQTAAWAFLTTVPTPGDTSGKLIAMAPIELSTPNRNDQIRLTFILALR